MPITDVQAVSPEIAGAFTGANQKSARQSELERAWASFAAEKYATAKQKAEAAALMAEAGLA